MYFTHHLRQRVTTEPTIMYNFWNWRIFHHCNINFIIIGNNAEITNRVCLPLSTFNIDKITKKNTFSTHIPIFFQKNGYKVP